MAVGTTRPALTAVYAAITDQKTAYLSHEGGGDVEIVLNGSGPAESVSGAIMRAGDKLIYRLAASEFLYARSSFAISNPPILTVMQSARA